MGRRERQIALEIAKEIERLPGAEQSERFFELIRASEIPYVPVRHRENPRKLFVDSFEAIYILARASLPLAVGLTMHQYMLGALATFPIRKAIPLKSKRDKMLRDIEEHRLLLAVASFGDNLLGRDQRPESVTVRPEGTGWVATGRKAFNSLAPVGDLLAFTADTQEGELGFFIVPLRGNPALKPGPAVFPDAMADTHTCSLTFDALRLARSNLLCLETEPTLEVLTFATAWFQALIAGAYLGAASRALEEVRRFAASVHTADGNPLLELDGLILDVGRLAVRLQACVRMAHQFAEVIAIVKAENLGFVADQVIEELIDFASQIKYLSTQVAEEVVSASRRLIGTRAMAPTHPVNRLSGQIVFGPLHPLVSAQIERDAGRKALRGVFLGLPGP